MDWNSRFVQQAQWTADLRAYLFGKAGLRNARRVLEVGCGTGAILSGLVTPASVHGLDLDGLRLHEARGHAPAAELTCGDGHRLPYLSGAFDITFCHYFLLWAGDPLKALLEMKRVTRRGGAVLALAEPDHEARVDKPGELSALGRWQTEALRRQGADPGLGGQLGRLFRAAGILPIETGRLREGEGTFSSQKGRDLEWAVLESDLAGSVPTEELGRLRLLDEKAWERGERVLILPTYFAWGKG